MYSTCSVRANRTKLKLGIQMFINIITTNESQTKIKAKFDYLLNIIFFYYFPLFAHFQPTHPQINSLAIHFELTEKFITLHNLLKFIGWNKANPISTHLPSTMN